MSLCRVTVILEHAMDGTPMPATIISGNRKVFRQFLSPNQVLAMGPLPKADWLAERIDNTWFLKKMVDRVPSEAISAENNDRNK